MHSYKKKGQLDLYQEMFEEPFLDASGEHYKKISAHLLQEKDVSMYIEKVIQKIDEELFRGKKFLHPSSLPKVSCEFEILSKKTC